MPLNGQAEWWPSGRRHTPAKGADGKPSRGFESLPLRHNSLIQNDFPVLRVNSPLFPGVTAVFRGRGRSWPSLNRRFGARVSRACASGSVRARGHLQGKNRKRVIAGAVCAIPAPETARDFWGLRASSLFCGNWEIKTPDQGIKSSGTGKEWAESGNAGAAAETVIAPPSPGRGCRSVILSWELGRAPRQVSAKRRACSAQSLGMPSRSSLASDRCTGWRPSRIAACSLGARKARARRVRMQGSEWPVARAIPVGEVPARGALAQTWASASTSRCRAGRSSVPPESPPSSKRSGTSVQPSCRWLAT
ncbi:MAG: hypothetical protein RLZZ528_1017 [Pseudomonadota bacterium]